MKLLLIPGILFFFYSCSTSMTEANTIALPIETEVGRLSDDSFIANIHSIDFRDNQFYLSDYLRNQILVLDEDLTLKNTISIGREGSGEFKGASSITVSEDFIYVVNDDKQQIEVFKGGEYRETINPQIILGLGTQLRFGVIDNTFYFSNPESQKSISHYHPNGEVFSFGDIQEFSTLSQTLSKNYTHVLMHSKGIITVSDNLPLITFYDFNRNVLSKVNYGNVPMIQEHMALLKKSPVEDNSYYILATDAYVFSDKLYVLLTLQSEKGPKSNKVLEIKIDKDLELPVTRTLDLGDGWFTTLCANETSLLSFNSSTGNIVKFEL